MRAARKRRANAARAARRRRAEIEKDRAPLGIAGLVLAFALSAAAAPDGADHLAQLQRAALAAALDEDPRWRALLHVERRWLPPGARGRASSEAFYLAPGGRSDPRRELLATLAAFFDAERRVKGEPAQCAFVARRHWLVDRLGIDPARLPLEPCPAFEAWREGLGPVAITLVYPEGFMSNPASMFGHTLLRIDRVEQESPANLTAHAVDFTAHTGGDAGPLYVLKGVFGLYPGRFGVSPYDEKLKQYADWQNRDVWEYRLDLRPEEVELLLMHLWELRAIDFPYYFFDENCSFRLLRLLEAARPSLRLTERFPTVAIPADTVRAVAREAGVERVRYRPSPLTSLRWRLARAGAAVRAAALALAEGRTGPDEAVLAELGPRDRARALELSYALLRFRALREDVAAPPARARAHALLLARSRLGPEAGDAPLFEPVPTPAVRPDEGHGSARFSLGGGVRDGEWFTELRLRPAFHALLDPEGGYTPGAQVVVLDARARVFPGPGRARLEELTLLDVASIAPIDRLATPLSWRFETGLRTRLFPRPGKGADAEPVWRSRAGFGLAARLGGLARVYGLAHTILDVAPALDDGVAAFGPGATLGLLARTPRDRTALHAFAQWHRFALGDRATWWRAGGALRMRVGRNDALALEAEGNRLEGERWLDASLVWHHYF